LPPSGCCVTSEYGPVERACILSSDQVMQLQHVHEAHGHLPVEGVARPPVVQVHLPGARQASRLEHVLDLAL